MKKHFMLFAWEVILREAETFIMEGWIEGKDFKNLR